MSNKRGFRHIIEPHFYDELKWDMDKIVRYLEYIRLNINDLFGHRHSKYYIISYGNFLGDSFPAMGVINENSVESKSFEDFDELYNRVQKWVEQVGLEVIENRSKELVVPRWNEILEFGYYPQE